MRKLAYTYDLGTGCDHEIVLERLVPAAPGQPHMQCMVFAGGPLEYPMLEDDDGSPIADPS